MPSNPPAWKRGAIRQRGSEPLRAAEELVGAGVGRPARSSHQSATGSRPATPRWTGFAGRSSAVTTPSLGYTPRITVRVATLAGTRLIRTGPTPDRSVDL